MSYCHFLSMSRLDCRGLVAVCMLGLTGPALADTVPNEFQSGETASAAEVNENFAALATAVSALQDRVESLEADISELQDKNTELQAELDAIKNSELFAREDFVVDLDQFLDIHFMSPADTAVEGPVVRLTGANFQIINAAGDQKTPDGTGNLVVGFAKARSGDNEVCSNGGHDNQTDCENDGNIWALAHNSGSHNIVGGDEPAYSQTGGIVVARQNAITRESAAVLAGWSNTASGVASSVSGGRLNTAKGTVSSIGGGLNNTTTGHRGSVSGGNGCTMSDADGWGAKNAAGIGLGDC